MRCRPSESSFPRRYAAEGRAGPTAAECGAKTDSCVCNSLQGQYIIFRGVEDGVRHVKLYDSSRCESYPGNCRSVPVAIVTAGRATDSSKLTRKESA